MFDLDTSYCAQFGFGFAWACHSWGVRMNCKQNSRKQLKTLKPTIKQTSWSQLEAVFLARQCRSCKMRQWSMKLPTGTLQPHTAAIASHWLLWLLLRQREKHRPLQRRTTPFVPWPGHGCSTSSSLTGFSLPFLLFLETLPSVLNVWMVLTSNLSLSWSHSVAGRHGMFEVSNTNLHSSCKCMGYSALACNIFQHFSTGKDGKRWAKHLGFIMFHHLRSVVSKTFWNGFELLNYLSIRHLDPFESLT